MEFEKRAARNRGSLYKLLPVVCGLGESHLLLGVYPEQFERRLLLLDGFKTEQNPKATKYRYIIDFLVEPH